MRKNQSEPRFINAAVNTYRTKHYIVKQLIYFSVEKDGHIFMGSDDVYYPRTPKRDKAYKERYGKSLLPEGQRIHTSVYTGYYVE